MLTVLAGLGIVILVGATSPWWSAALRPPASLPNAAAHKEEEAHSDHGHEEHAGHDKSNSIKLSENALKNIGVRSEKIVLGPFERVITLPAMTIERPGRSQIEVTAPLTGVVSVAARNGILLLNHYLHLVKYEGEGWTHEMILRGGLERLAPVLMTALTAVIALIPLTMSAGEPGKEILYPVATVIVGGLISSTLLDFFVHPALFWTMGLKAAQRVLESEEESTPLADHEAVASES